ncbi:RES family NAD+ phosphorylase [Tunicatimonas pelagia]|uniref:RES family NAD+ phosphorylase n=1 Tax=Tunicatimonas pelagia TaxID=931531 RepID=UPI002665A34E|nr:RES family NAD+ phosphorylase [Tunicatimonas pelagia]WKN45903.1 RES family NAD+ phosphorylase [Tunicatimonas pelagia]
MEVYRITLAKYADQLFAPGLAGRWNRKEQLVIYTAASRSLACLENLVHRRGIGLQQSYQVMAIHVPDQLTVQRIEESDLIPNWRNSIDQSETQLIGSQWYQEARKPVLSVPSAIVPAERNIVINTKHPDFAKVQLIGTEPFAFDPRLNNALPS